MFGPLLSPWLACLILTDGFRAYPDRGLPFHVDAWTFSRPSPAFTPDYDLMDPAWLNRDALSAHLRNLGVA